MLYKKEKKWLLCLLLSCCFLYSSEEMNTYTGITKEDKSIPLGFLCRKRKLIPALPFALVEHNIAPFLVDHVHCGSVGFALCSRLLRHRNSNGEDYFPRQKSHSSAAEEKEDKALSKSPDFAGSILLDDRMLYSASAIWLFTPSSRGKYCAVKSNVKPGNYLVAFPRGNAIVSVREREVNILLSAELLKPHRSFISFEDSSPLAVLQQQVDDVLKRNHALFLPHGWELWAINSTPTLLGYLYPETDSDRVDLSPGGLQEMRGSNNVKVTAYSPQARAYADFSVDFATATERSIHPYAALQIAHCLQTADFTRLPLAYSNDRQKLQMHSTLLRVPCRRQTTAKSVLS